VKLLAGAILGAALALTGCGAKTDTTAPPQTVARASARFKVGSLCHRAQLELRAIRERDLGDVTARAVRLELEDASRQSAALLQRTIGELEAQGSQAPLAQMALARLKQHRVLLAELRQEIHAARTHTAGELPAWFRRFAEIDAACGELKPVAG